MNQAMLLQVSRSNKLKINKEMGRIKHGVGQCPYCKKFVKRRANKCNYCRRKVNRGGQWLRTYGGQLVSERELKEMTNKSYHN